RVEKLNAIRVSAGQPIVKTDDLRETVLAGFRMINGNFLLQPQSLLTANLGSVAAEQNRMGRGQEIDSFHVSSGHFDGPFLGNARTAAPLGVGTHKSSPWGE